MIISRNFFKLTWFLRDNQPTLEEITGVGLLIIELVVEIHDNWSMWKTFVRIVTFASRLCNLVVNSWLLAAEFHVCIQPFISCWRFCNAPSSFLFTFPQLSGEYKGLMKQICRILWVSNISWLRIWIGLQYILLDSLEAEEQTKLVCESPLLAYWEKKNDLMHYAYTAELRESPLRALL